PVAGAVVDSTGVIAVADLKDERPRVIVENEIECHALRPNPPCHIEGDSYAIRMNPLQIVNDSAAAGSAEIARSHVSRETECALPDHGHADIEGVAGDKILEVDVPGLVSHGAVDPANLRQCLGQPPDCAEDVTPLEGHAIALDCVLLVARYGPEPAR